MVRRRHWNGRTLSDTWACISRHLTGSVAHSTMPKDHFTGPSIVFWKIERIAGENVIIELLKIKCLPCMYYGLEACPVSKSQIKSLHFAILIVHSTVGWTIATATGL